MILPVQTVRLFQSTPVCDRLACVSEVLAQPPIQSVPVYDALGIEYARDIEVTQGFYVLLVAYAALRALQSLILHAVARHKD